MNCPPLGLDRSGREQRPRRLVHKWHEFVRKSGHRTPDANATDVWTSTDTAHPAAFPYITLDDGSPASKLDNAERRTIFLCELCLLVVASAVTPFMDRAAKQP